MRDSEGSGDFSKYRTDQRQPQPWLILEGNARSTKEDGVELLLLLPGSSIKDKEARKRLTFELGAPSYAPLRHFLSFPHLARGPVNINPNIFLTGPTSMMFDLSSLAAPNRPQESFGVYRGQPLFSALVELKLVSIKRRLNLS